MRVGKNVWVLGLAMMLVAGLAVASEVDEAAAPEKVDVKLEMAEAELPQQEAKSEAVAGEAEPSFTSGFGSGPKGFTCSCECTCPASGAFVVQTFTLPAWTNRSCGSFNGDACSIGPFDTCNTVRRYQNCVTL